MSQKKRKRERERIPALSGSIETPPTMSFQLELKLQHYIIPKTSLWLIIPWEPGTDAARRVTDAAAGANSPFWVHGLRDRPRAALGQPPKPLPSPEIGLTTGATNSWCDIPTIPSSHPTGSPRCRPGRSFSSQLEELGLAGAGGAEGGGKMLFMFQNRSAYSTNPEIPKPVKALSRPSRP